MELEIQAEECFHSLDSDNNGDVSLEEMIMHTVHLHNDRLDVAKSMQDVVSILKSQDINDKVANRLLGQRNQCLRQRFVFHCFHYHSPRVCGCSTIKRRNYARWCWNSSYLTVLRLRRMLNL